MKRIIPTIITRGIALLILIFPLTVKAQETTKKEPGSSQSDLFKLNKEKMFIPVITLESWATYSMGEKKNNTSYADRAGCSLRRLRFGASGNPYPWLKYSFQLHADRLGEDSYASTKGSYGGIDIWNAYISAKLLQNSDLLNLHAGYFWAAISRQYNTSPWAVGSFDKTRACWYLRNFMTGKGNGIESGIALGGLKNFDKFGISYRIGTYEPAAYESAKYASRLYTERVMFSFGDPEQTSYKYMLSGNQWQKRNGVTLGLGASTQANGVVNDTTFFDKLSAYGADILINYKGLRIDAEYYKMKKEAEGFADYKGTEFHVYAGYSFLVKGKFIEPSVCYEKYEGEGAKALYKYIGDDHTLDIGVNWYLNKDKLKLALHYLVQGGSTSSNVGDYIGLGCQLKL